LLAYITYFIVTKIIRFVQLEANLAAAGSRQEAIQDVNDNTETDRKVSDLTVLR